MKAKEEEEEEEEEEEDKEEEKQEEGIYSRLKKNVYKIILNYLPPST